MKILEALVYAILLEVLLLLIALVILKGYWIGLEELLGTLVILTIGIYLIINDE
jgi:hypothetical protein